MSNRVEFKEENLSANAIAQEKTSVFVNPQVVWPVAPSFGSPIKMCQ